MPPVRPPGPPRRRPRRTVLGWVGRILGMFVALGMVAAAAGGFAAWRYYEKAVADLPTLDSLRHYQPPVMSRIYAGNDALMAELATERRIFVPYTAIPPLVRQAFVSAEDRNFFVHGGIDPAAILRAGFSDLMHLGEGRRPIGASTITQQVAKNMLLDNKVSLSRKIREAILATRIDQTLSKERVLEIYLNEIYLGLGSYGVAAAAQTYFGKSLDQLTLAEAAFLGALPKGPNNYNPFRFPEAARARRDWVLDRMAEDHAITPAEAQAAKAQPIDAVPFHHVDTVPGADWFTEEVRRQLLDKFGADITNEGGLIVHTSLNPGLQAEADRTLREGLVRYDQAHDDWRGPATRLRDAALREDWQADLAKLPRPPGMMPAWQVAVVLQVAPGQAELGWLPEEGGKPAPRVSPMYLSDISWARHDGVPPRRMADVLKAGDVVMVQPAAGPPARGRGKAAERLLLRQIPRVQGALVAMQPQTGRVLAMVGGWSADISQFNRATQAQRQPGSSFKPMVYLAALEQGISPSQRFLDGPFTLNLPNGDVWRPSDFEHNTFLGDVPMRVALEKSLNLPTVRIANRIGMAAVARTAEAFHVVDQMPHFLAASLGAVDTTVLRQAGAYASLAMEGREVIPHMVDDVQDRDGHVLWRPPGIACQGCDDPSHPPELTDQRRQIADPASTYQLIRMMEGVVQRGTGVPAVKGIDQTIAGKTGTSQEARDAWFVGFTPDLVTAVWVGYDDPASLGKNAQGATVAAPIWHDFMAEATKGQPKLDFPMPAGLTLATWDSGYGRVTDAFKPDQVPGAGGAGGDVSTASDGAGAAAGSAATLDSDMGGLY